MPSLTSLAANLAFLLALSTVAFGQAPPEPPGPAPTPKVATKGKAKVVPKAKAKVEAAGPTVMSSDAYAAARGKAGPVDRYGAGQPDWAEIPPWRQASFFGLRAEGRVFVFVVDCSGSMDDDARLDRAKAELIRAVRALQAPQRFKVIFYDDAPVPMPGDLPKPADQPSKAQLARWLDLVQPGGGTDPRGALALALALRPDAVFLLSDGAFPAGTAEAIARGNPGKVPIHCVDLANGTAGDDLRRIAAGSGGQYAPKGR